MQKKKIAVIFGGNSTEYEVSLQSAFSVFENINKEKFDIVPIGITRNGDWYHFGITKVTKQQELENAIQLAFEHDAEVIVEEAIGGFEVGCAILGIDNLTVGRIDEIELSNGFFDYTEKYTLKTSKIHMPARLSPKEEKRVQETAVAIYKALGCSGFARVDMFYTPSNEIIFNEVNTIPGLTSHSRYPNMMKGIGLSFADMLDKLISLYVE